MTVYSRIFLLLTFLFHSYFLSAQRTMRIVVTPKDSVYKWDNHDDGMGGSLEFSIDEGTVIYFDNELKKLSAVLPVSGRGSSVGLETSFYASGMIEHQGRNGYTTDVDSLKDVSRDGFLDYVGKVGWWYYWNEQGILMRKERWNKDKLIETIYYQTTLKRNNRGGAKSKKNSKL